MNTAQLTALKNELLTDPQALGYAALLAVGNHEGCAALLNDPAHGAQLALPTAAVDRVRGEIVPSEYAALSANDRTYLQFLLSGETMYLTTTVRTWLSGVAGLTATKAACAALFDRTGTRAEVLFGVGTVVTHGDVSAALKV